MKRPGYIGVCAIGGDATVNYIYNDTKVQAAIKDSDYIIAIGVLGSSVTLSGKRSQSHPYRNPPKEEWRAYPHRKFPSLITVFHYHCTQREAFRQEIAEVIRLIGPDYHGLQLNNPWLDVEDVAWCKALMARGLTVPQEEQRLILQIGSEALAACGNHPDRIAERVKLYGGVITDALYDPSGGLGVALNPTIAAPILRTIRLACPDIGLGAAGKLGPDTVNLIAPLLREFPGMSTDAESGVRDVESDRFHIGRSIDYIHLISAHVRSSN